MDDEEIGLTDLMSFPNLALSAPLMEKSELLQEEDKHDFVRPEAMIKSIDMFIM